MAIITQTLRVANINSENPRLCEIKTLCCGLDRQN